MTQVNTRKFTQNNYLAHVATPLNPNIVGASPQRWRIALKNLEQRNSLIFDLLDTVTIGRDPSANGDIPHIGLQPYNAYELGVSRRHAVFKLEDGCVFLIDNNSANGVLLNHEKLRPEVLYPVRHGDIIKLGQMSLQVNFLISSLYH